MTLTEGDLKFNFPDAIAAMQFDGDEHGLSHCMKAVDFIVEFANYFLFVEVKDPELPPALALKAAAHVVEARKQAITDFTRKFQSGNLRNELVTKFRDTFIYRWAENRLEKPIHYFVLLELPSVDKTFLGPELQRLRGGIPYSSPGLPCKRWTNSIAGECQLLDIESWNRNLKWPIERLSDLR